MLSPFVKTFHFSYTRAGATLKCDILSAIKGKSVDGHFLAILSQTIPIAIPIGLCRVAPSRYQPLTCRRQDFPEGDQVPSGDFMFNIGVNLGSANPISRPFSYLWQKDERGYADIKYGAGVSVTEVISAELQYDEKNVYFKGKISWAQRMTQKRDVTLPGPVESGWSFSYETKTAK